MWLRRSHRVPLTLSLRNLFSKVGRRSVFIITSGECDERLWFWVSISFQLCVCVRERHSFVHWEAFFLSLQNQFHPVIRLSIGFDVVYGRPAPAQGFVMRRMCPHIYSSYIHKQYAKRKESIKINSMHKKRCIWHSFHVDNKSKFCFSDLKQKWSAFCWTLVCLEIIYVWVYYQIIVPFQVLQIEHLKFYKR